MMDRANRVVERHPTPVLLTRADHTASAKFEWREHVRERSALRRENYSKPQIHNANARLSRGSRSLFPIAAHAGQEAFAERRGFRKHLVAPITVVADRRSADQHLRFQRTVSQMLAQRTGGSHSCV